MGKTASTYFSPDAVSSGAPIGALSISIPGGCQGQLWSGTFPGLQNDQERFSERGC